MLRVKILRLVFNQKYYFYVTLLRWERQLGIKKINIDSFYCLMGYKKRMAIFFFFLKKKISAFFL